MKSSSVVLLLMVLFVIFGNLHAQEANKDSPSSENQASSKEEQAVATKPNQEIVSDNVVKNEIEAFEQDRGLALFPESKNFWIRNSLKNSIAYESNIFLSDQDRQDDGIYTIDFSSNLVYKTGHFLLDFSAGINYQDYFEENSLDTILPWEKLRMKYEDKGWYMVLEEKISRYNVVRNNQLNGRFDWNQYWGNFIFGLDSERWFLEISTSENYVDYRKLLGDYQVYGQTYTAGYKIDRKLDLTAEYGWNIIDYREAFYLPDKLRKQRDTWEHIFIVGAKIKLLRNLLGSAKAGLSSRHGKLYPYFYLNLNWELSPRLTTKWEGIISTVPSFFDDFQLGYHAKIGIQYLLTRQLMANLSASVEYTTSDRIDNSIRYMANAALTYRIFKGFDVVASYQGDFFRTDNPSGNYIDHKLMATLNIVF